MKGITKTLTESAAVLAAGLVIIGAVMFAFAQSAEAHKAGARSVGSTLEVTIADTGRTVVRGAEVTGISDGTIRARTEWGASSITWTVETGSDTTFVTKAGSGTDLDDIAVGDYVSFSGTLSDSDAAFVIDADAVKNWSSEDQSRKDTHKDIRAEARAEAKGRFSDWAKHMPILNWFNKDHR